jgi:hypothetical protein
MDYGKGFDYDASLASHDMAIELNPTPLDLQQSLAKFLEFNQRAFATYPMPNAPKRSKYSATSNGTRAPLEPEVDDNLIIVLFYAGRFGKVLPELATLPTVPVRNGVVIPPLPRFRVPQPLLKCQPDCGDEQKKKDAINLPPRDSGICGCTVRLQIFSPRRFQIHRTRKLLLEKFRYFGISGHTKERIYRPQTRAVLFND